jgi:hypothetical protein
LWSSPAARSTGSRTTTTTETCNSLTDPTCFPMSRDLHLGHARLCLTQRAFVPPSAGALRRWSIARPRMVSLSEMSTIQSIFTCIIPLFVVILDLKGEGAYTRNFIWQARNNLILNTYNMLVSV